MYLTDADRATITYDDLARVADCHVCHEEARVWPHDDGAGDTIELCRDCADLFGWGEGEDR